MSVPIFESSTQFKHWKYSQSGLAETRSSLNVAAVKVIKRTLEADEVCRPDKVAEYQLVTPQSLAHRRTSNS